MTHSFTLRLNGYEAITLRKLLREHANGQTIHPFDVRLAQELSGRKLICPDCHQEHEGNCA